MLMPMVAMADFDELDMRNQMLDSQIQNLTQQRDEKYAALQKCEKSTKGFKIAGITTLVATGVGVYGNIKLSQKLKGKDGKGHSNIGADGKVLSVHDSKKKMCDDEAEDNGCAENSYTEEQCDAFNDCWAKDATGSTCSWECS